MTHDTIECRRFTKDSRPKDKPGSGDSSQMAHLMKRLIKLEMKHEKAKKHGKKCAHDSSDSDSDSDYDNGSSSLGNPVDKRLKLV